MATICRNTDTNKAHIHSGIESIRKTPGGTWPGFFVLCLYIVSQAVQIPIIAIGPSWTLWPTLSDLIVPVLIFVYIFSYRRLQIKNESQRKVYRGLLLITGGMGFWFLLSVSLNMLDGGSNSSQVINTGLYQIFRLGQFLIVYRVAAGIVYSRKRVRILSAIATVVFLAVIAGLAGTYTGIINTNALVAHLPNELNVAGPWAFLSLAQQHDVGLLGYNHAFTALQIILLLGLSLSLRTGKNSFAEALLILLAASAILMTQSRAGLAGMLFFMFVYFSKKPAVLGISAAISIIFLLTGLGVVRQMDIDLNESIERAMTIREPLDPENLSGRDQLWEQSIAFLNENPTRWITGAGPGSVKSLPNNAHMLYLQIVMECGFIGLIIFGAVMRNIIRQLRKKGKAGWPLALCTFAFLITSITQETFYPVPAFGHFLGLYLASIAIVLGIRHRTYASAGSAKW